MHPEVAVARALDWRGVPVTVAPFGRPVTVFAEAVAEEVAWRREHRQGPYSRADLGLIELLDDEAWGRPSPVRIAGAITTSNWGTGLETVGLFAGLCARAVLLPAVPRRRDAFVMDAAFYGVSVAVLLGSESPQMLYVGAARPLPPKRAVAHRVFDEMVFAELLDHTSAGARTG